jgi:hypothetical protein
MATMPRPPFEGGEPEERVARPMPCPECLTTPRGYQRVGDFRVQCLNCNALLKNEEVDMQLPNKENK